jgi:hypothetical protein
MERILLSSKKTCLHDDVLHILSMHLDPILPLPRPRMLSVLYHVLSTVPAYHPSVGPMLNELCLGLKGNDLAEVIYSFCSLVLRFIWCYDILTPLFI